MSNLEQTEPPTPIDSNINEPGGMGIGEVTEIPPVVAPSIEAKLAPTAAQRRAHRPGTVEHLATRRTLPALNADAPEVKEQIIELRAELTALVTGLRWGGQSVQDTAERIISLLNVGPLQQWIPVLVPNVLEIDRAGNLVPVWLKIIAEDDPSDLPPDANPADTMLGRARRFAILMLGYYKSPELSELLGKLATDPNSSLYATQSLVRQGTVAALQAMATALKDAEGWAKVDLVEAYATMNQARFYDILLASGLDRAHGLESYIAVPLYRTIALERYLRAEKGVAPRLSQQAALVVSQVLQDSMNNTNADSLPIIFERDLPMLATALFDGARSAPGWQNVVALHRLGLMLGYYWRDISRGVVQDPRIVQPVYACLPIMPSVERWMNGPARDVLLEALSGEEEEAILPSMKVLSELHDLRAVSALIARLEATTQIADREQALQLGHICDMLAQLGDRSAVGPMRQLISRVVNVGMRSARPKRSDNLDLGDPDIPTSIVYGAGIRAFGQLGDRSTIDLVERAASDFDPYVRTQALDALKSIDPSGEEMRSRMVVHDALSDPRDTVVRAACQLAIQYHDTDAVPLLRTLAEIRPELAAAANDALRRLGH
jgi:HEAT repeats